MNEPSISVAQVRRTGLSEQVAQQLLGLIRAGNLKPGDLLPPERELAQQLGVSRPVVREALKALSTFGMIRTQHGGGSFVTVLEPEALIGPLSLCLALSDQDLPQIFEARAAIEVAVVRNAARCISAGTIQALRDNLRRQRAVLKDTETCSVLTDEFRRMIIDACDNAYLTALALSLEIIAKQARLMYLANSKRLREHFERHVRIVDALEARDPDRAAQAVEAHLQALARDLLGARSRL